MYPACLGLYTEKVLTPLKSRPEISEKKLAGLSGIRRSRLASWLERLEYEGLVELDSRDGDDAKVILTKAGAKEAGKIGRSRAKAESLFDCLPDVAYNWLPDHTRPGAADYSSHRACFPVSLCPPVRQSRFFQCQGGAAETLNFRMAIGVIEFNP